MLAVAFGVISLVCAGCDLGQAELGSAVDAPPLHLLQVSATTGYDAHGQPLRTALRAGQITEGVRTTASLSLSFDRFLLPERVIRQTICLRPGTGTVVTMDDCAKPYQPFLEPSYYPLQRQVVFRQQAGDRLEAQTLYRLTVLVPTPDGEHGFRAFDGAVLDRSYVFEFRTGDTEPSEHEEPLPSPQRYCDAISCCASCRNSHPGDASAQQQCITAQCDCLDGDCYNDGLVVAKQNGVLATSCGYAGCHHGADAAMGLDLSSPGAIAWTAIDRVAHLSQTGEDPESPDRSPERFGRAMSVVAPSDPSNSYALYKLAIHPLYPIVTQADSAPQVAEEQRRLRSAAVVGLPMPADDGRFAASTGPSWTQRLLLIQNWIAHGAVTSCQ